MLMQLAGMDDVVGEVDRSASEKSVRHVYAAVCVIGVAYFLAFVCYGGTDGLHSGGGDGQLPRYCVMTIICVCSIVSSMLLAPAFVSRLSPNTALCVAWGSHSLYAMANLYPTAGTLLPAAVIVGATIPAIAVAQGIYTTALADRWCRRLSSEGEVDDMRLTSERTLRCGCTRCPIDDNLRRENVFMFFNSILMVCAVRETLSVI